MQTDRYHDNCRLQESKNLYMKRYIIIVHYFPELNKIFVDKTITVITTLLKLNQLYGKK